jgi:hypothetical protein
VGSSNQKVNMLMRTTVCLLLFQLHLEFTEERTKSEGVPLQATKAYRGSRSIVPLILTIRIGWRWLVSSTSLSLSATKRTPRTHSMERGVNRSGPGGETCLCLDSSPRSSSSQNSRYTEHLIQDRMDSYMNHVEFWKTLYFYTYILF